MKQNVNDYKAYLTGIEDALVGYGMKATEAHSKARMCAGLFKGEDVAVETEKALAFCAKRSHPTDFSVKGVIFLRIRVGDADNRLLDYIMGSLACGKQENYRLYKELGVRSFKELRHRYLEKCAA